jgi:hypothetical protein
MRRIIGPRFAAAQTDGRRFATAVADPGPAREAQARAFQGDRAAMAAALRRRGPA